MRKKRQQHFYILRTRNFQFQDGKKIKPRKNPVMVFTRTQKQAGKF